jgi:aminoglycoside adenylyltransferase-like protein/nucleotidyltransferase-like protein
MKTLHNDAYPELASVLQRFVARAQNALGSNFRGAYLVGSLATGDFDLESDVDFLVLINVELCDAEVKSLEAMHGEIHALGNYPAEHLEGSYLTAELLNQSDTVGLRPVWYVDNGSTSLERSVHDNRWHVRWILRERGIVMTGSDPRTFLPPIPIDALRSEALSSVRELARRFLAEVDQPLGWFNTRFGQSFAVLTCCRMLQTWASGAVESKFHSVTWAEQYLDPVWCGLIRQAWIERKGVRFGEKVHQPAATNLMHETAEFLAHAVRLAETARACP